jgi:hypothetical protein
MNECYYLFYVRNTQVILDSMNANLALTLERFAANSELGAAVNSQLEKTDVATRVIVAMPTGYGFEDGKFVFVAAEPVKEITENEV